jgi:hypothetical protein
MQKLICECGKIYTRKNKSQHMKSMYHQQYIENQKYSKRQEKKQERSNNLFIFHIKFSIYIIYITTMQQLFNKFENKEQITDSEIPFSFTELNELYCKTD